MSYGEENFQSPGNDWVCRQKGSNGKIIKVIIWRIWINVPIWKNIRITFALSAWVTSLADKGMLLRMRYREIGICARNDKNGYRVEANGSPIDKKKFL